MKATVIGLDTAGSTLVAAPGRVSGLTFNGQLVAVVGDEVVDHGPPPQHNGATLTQGVQAFTVNGLAVVVAGKLASCADAATGSGFDVQGT